MKIAICDDSPAQLARLASFLSEREAVETALFGSGRELLESIRRRERYEIILLDIRLTDVLGTALAEEIARLLPQADIAFVSAYPQYVTDAFRLRVSQFFLKPLEKERFLQEFDRLVERRARERAVWHVKSKDRQYRFSPADVIYVEAYHRHLQIHTRNGSCEVVGKLSDAEEALGAYGFAPCHQGYLVNLRLVREVGVNELVCEPDHHIPVSSRKRAAFLERYARFMEQY